MKTVLEVRTESHHFRNRDIIGGDPALDFVNTVTGRDQSPRDWLDSYPRLLEWAAFVHLLPKRVLRALAKKAQKEPAAAAIALACAKPCLSWSPGSFQGARRRKAPWHFFASIGSLA